MWTPATNATSAPKVELMKERKCKWRPWATAVLEAVAEILRQEGIPPSPTAVFAAVMSSLERSDTQAAPEVSGAMLTVLGVALEHAPTAPVLSKLPACAKVLMSAGQPYTRPPLFSST